MRAFAIFHLLGLFLLIEGLGIFAGGLLSLVDRNEVWISLMYSASIPVLFGGFIVISTPKVKDLNTRESLMVVVLGWLLISTMGALPFLLTGSIPHITDAIFESVSGFTTTGSSILTDIESIPRGVLLWRSLTHFIGGMGIILLALAIIPMVGIGGMTLLRSENPIMGQEQSVPLLAVWLRIILIIYVALIALETVLLFLAGLPIFDAITHAFGTIATGGFSPKNQSIASLDNVYAELIIIVFMFAGGMNFAIYYHLLRRKFQMVLKRDDFLFYIFFTACAIALITFVNWRHLYASCLESLRFSAFQVVSISTTTGFVNTDFNYWPEFSKIFLILLMLMGACAGSTSGAIKNIRIVILFKCLVRELKKMLHPSGVFIVRVNGKRVEESDLLRTIVFVSTYLLIFLIITTLLLLATNLDPTSALSATAATLGGVGPGLALVGPMGNFADVSTVGKWILILSMLLGRLEILAFLVVIHPKFWLPLNIKWRSTSE